MSLTFVSLNLKHIEIALQQLHQFEVTKYTNVQLMHYSTNNRQGSTNARHNKGANSGKASSGKKLIC